MLTKPWAVMRLVRTMARFSWILLVAALVLPGKPAEVRLRYKARWCGQLLRSLGVRLAVQGDTTARGLIVANHISWLDILTINYLTPASMVAKAEIRQWPLVGWISDSLGTLFMERGSRSAAQKAREQLLAELRAGSSVGVFPEGTTSLGTSVLPFHGALFQAAIDAPAAVIPVVLHYTDALGKPVAEAAYVGETSFWQSALAIVAVKDLVAHANYLPAIDSRDYDRRHLAHHCHQLIAHQLAANLHAAGHPD